jgi:hypothetical protein
LVGFHFSKDISHRLSLLLLSVGQGIGGDDSSYDSIEDSAVF